MKVTWISESVIEFIVRSNKSNVEVSAFIELNEKIVFELGIVRYNIIL